MNFNWLKPQEVLNDDYAITAEMRLMALKKAGKIIKKSVEESLRTNNSRSSVKNEELDAKKRRAVEHIHGENLASASQVLTETKTASNVTSPLQTILEHYANLEKTMAHMLAVHESEMETLINGNTPLFKLVSDEIPSYSANKKDLEHLAKKHVSANNLLEKELRRLEKMEQQRKDQIESSATNGEPHVSSTTTPATSENSVEDHSTTEVEDSGSILAQREKTDKLLYEKEVLEKDLGIEEAKVTSQLLTLTSRENRYAVTVYNLMRLKKRFFEDAFRTIEAELPNLERILLETPQRPVFGERLSDHLRSTGRRIALPIHLPVHNLRQFGLQEEGLFRISPKQIKLDKYKAQMDANVGASLDAEDAHLQAGLLKCYLRELPEPLLTTVDEESISREEIYLAWMEAASIKPPEDKVRQFRSVLAELTPQAFDNVQFLMKFLSRLSRESDSTKMNSKNLAIVLGPNLLSRSPLMDQGKLDSVISIMVTLIQRYDDIFLEDVSLDAYDDDLDTFKEALSAPQSLKIPPGGNQSSENNNQQLSPGMSQKRRQSFRTFRKNIMAKLSPPSNPNNAGNALSLSPSFSHKPIVIEKDPNSI